MNVIIILLTVITSHGLAKHKFAGPFDALVKEPFVCEDEGTKEVYFNDTTVRKKAKNLYAVTTMIHTRIMFDEELQLKVNFAVWGNGGWRPNFLTLDYGGACSHSAEILPGVFAAIKAVNNVSSSSLCPIYPGDYKIDEANANPVVSIQSLPYNKYKVYMMFMKPDGNIAGCLGMVTEIVPKEKKG